MRACFGRVIKKSVLQNTRSLFFAGPLFPTIRGPAQAAFFVHICKLDRLFSNDKYKGLNLIKTLRRLSRFTHLFTDEICADRTGFVASLNVQVQQY